VSKIKWKEVHKFLSGAFFVAAGASWYFAMISLPVPFMGKVMSPESLAVRGVMHFVFFLLSFYFGFIRKSAEPSK
jgi:hypothetical protein